MYEAKKFDHLLGLDGFSDNALNLHFTLYQGYVTNVNKLWDSIIELDKAGKQATPEFSELKRRVGWEFNGMRLHELYFENLTKGGKELKPDSNIYKKITAQFGSYESWLKYFKATGMMRGIGWVVVYYEGGIDKLFVSWINEHDVGHLTGLKPIMIMDVFEHAFIPDYGTKRADYIEAFLKNVDWDVVEKRLG